MWVTTLRKARTLVSHAITIFYCTVCLRQHKRAAGLTKIRRRNRGGDERCAAGNEGEYARGINVGPRHWALMLCLYVFLVLGGCDQVPILRAEMGAGARRAGLERTTT